MDGKTKTSVPIRRTLAESCGADYIARINRAYDHILTHLHGSVPLRDVAAAAGLSAWHFHRVFHGQTGETLHAAVSRLRLERALQMLMRDPRPRITDVALGCGYSSSSHFVNVFRQRFGVAPGRFDRQRWREQHRGELDRLMDGDGHRLLRLQPGENPNGCAANVRALPSRTVAYLRVHDPYHQGKVEVAVEQLITWAKQRGLASGQWLGYQWEDPDVVPLADCRYDVAVEVPADTSIDGNIGRLTFPPMLVAEVQVRGSIDAEQQALDWLYQTWLPASRAEPADLPCFEAWDGLPFAHGQTHFELRVQLPLQT